MWGVKDVFQMAVCSRIVLFTNKMENGELNLPHAKILPGRFAPPPYVLVADDAFPLSNYLLKPYKTNLTIGFQEPGVLWKMLLVC